MINEYNFFCDFSAFTSEICAERSLSEDTSHVKVKAGTGESEFKKNKTELLYKENCILTHVCGVCGADRRIK